MMMMMWLGTEGGKLLGFLEHAWLSCFSFITLSIVIVS
jgi:hypothetical protein